MKVFPARLSWHGESEVSGYHFLERQNTVIKQ